MTCGPDVVGDVPMFVEFDVSRREDLILHRVEEHFDAQQGFYDPDFAQHQASPGIKQLGNILANTLNYRQLEFDETRLVVLGALNYSYHTADAARVSQPGKIHAEDLVTRIPGRPTAKNLEQLMGQYFSHRDTLRTLTDYWAEVAYPARRQSTARKIFAISSGAHFLLCDVRLNACQNNTRQPTVDQPTLL